MCYVAEFDGTIDSIDDDVEWATFPVNHDGNAGWDALEQRLQKVGGKLESAWALYENLFHRTGPVRPARNASEEEIKKYISDVKSICSESTQLLKLAGFSNKELLKVLPFKACFAGTTSVRKITASEVIGVLLDKFAIERWQENGILEDKVRVIINTIQQKSFEVRERLGVRTYVILYIGDGTEDILAKKVHDLLAINFEYNRHTRSFVREKHEREGLINYLLSVYGEHDPEAVIRAVNLGDAAYLGKRYRQEPSVSGKSIFRERKAKPAVLLSAIVTLLFAVSCLFAMLILPFFAIFGNYSSIVKSEMAIATALSGFGLLLASEIANKIDPKLISPYDTNRYRRYARIR